MTAACMNLHIGEQPPLVIAFNHNFTSIISDYPSMTVQQLGLLALLSSVFDIRTNNYWMEHMPWVPIMQGVGLNIGELVDNTLDPRIPLNTLTLITYTKKSLKNSFKREVPYEYAGTPEDWAQELETTLFENLTSKVDKYFPAIFSFIAQPLVISFSAVTEQEMEVYSEGKSTTVYENGFEWLKSSLGSTSGNILSPTSPPVTLDVSGDREKISIKTEVFIAFAAGDPEAPPTPIPVIPEGGYPKTYINIKLPTIKFAEK